MATITGTSGNDSLTGTSGNDTLSGLGGNDTLVASGGTDFYDGGTGTDTLDLRMTSAGITLSFANGTTSGGFSGTFINIERVLGSDGADSLIGASGNQTLSGRGGNDTFAGGVGVDTLWGGSGADSFVFRETGTANADSIADFASASDKIVLDGSVMTALGASGNFTAGDARFVANSTGTAQDADDRVIFNTTTKQLFYDADGSASGAAVLVGTLQSGATLSSTDIVVEGSSASVPGEVINGTEGNDSIQGTPGNDTISGHGGEDTINGAGGHDSIEGGAGTSERFSWLSGDDGNDTVVGGTGIDALYGGAGNDQLFGAEGDDDFVGGAGDDFLSGGAGRDEFTISEFQTPGIRSYGNDTIDGGPGDLDILFVSQIAPLQVNLGAGTLTGGVPGSAQISNIEYFFVWEADVFDDRLVGSSANNYLAAGGGNDVLDGAGGDDWIDGGTGRDTTTGGAGHDNFRFQEAPGSANADRITDFTSGIDTIWLDGHIHRGIGGHGPFAFEDERFYSAPGASSGHDATDRVVYDTSTGNLWFDSDGNGSGSAQLIATLGPGVALSALDIMVEGEIRPFVFQGGPENSEVHGTELGDTLNGGSGNDTLRGFGGDDVLNGEDGNDSVVGGLGNDSITGGTGSDLFAMDVTPSALNADEIRGFESGADSVHFYAPVFTALGGSGQFAPDDERFHLGGAAHDPSDRLIYDGANLWYDPDGTGAQTQQLVATLLAGDPLVATDIHVFGGALFRPINGTSGNDTLTGTAGNDTLNGLGGNDTLVGSGANDFYDGGTGTDTLDLRAAVGGVTVNFASGGITGGFSGTIVNMERVLGSDGADVLLGAAGNQTLSARSANDTLGGGTGNDTLWGGGGADAFAFGEMGTANADRVSDFASGTDKLHLDDAAFTAVGAMGNFAAGDARFKANASGTATDTSDRVVFNTSTGQLYYDADGSGAGTAQLIATVQSGATVAAIDIVVI